MTIKKCDVVYHGDALLSGYAFKSMKLTQKFMPWVNTIHLLYDDNDDAVKKVLAKYKKFISDNNINCIKIQSFLPKAYHGSINNSCIVESWLFKAKDIAEHFIYMCDDMFVGKPCPITHFFVNNMPITRIYPGNPDHNCKPVSNIPYVQMWCNAIQNHGIHYTRISHNALPLKKSLLKKYYLQFKDLVDNASATNTVRSGEKDFNILRIASSLMINDGSAYMRIALDSEEFFCESNQSDEILSIKKMKPFLFCVNNIHGSISNLNNVINSLSKTETK